VFTRFVVNFDRFLQEIMSTHMIKLQVFTRIVVNFDRFLQDIVSS